MIAPYAGKIAWWRFRVCNARKGFGEISQMIGRMDLGFLESTFLFEAVPAVEQRKIQTRSQNVGRNSDRKGHAKEVKLE